MNPRRLYRSRDRRLAGVAGGMAEYLDIDPTVMRILWILAGLLSVGFAILAYLLLAIVIPDAPWSGVPNGPQPMWGQAAQAPTPGWAQPTPGWASTPQAPVAPPAPTQTGYAPAQDYGTPPGWAPTGSQPTWAQPSGWGTAGPAPESRAQGRGLGAAAIVGLVLIAIGAIALLNVAIPGWIAHEAIGPMILVLIGGAFLVSSIRRTPREVAPQVAAVSAAPAPAPTAPATSPDPVGVVDDATEADIPVVETPGEAGLS